MSTKMVRAWLYEANFKTEALPAPVPAGGELIP